MTIESSWNPAFRPNTSAVPPSNTIPTARPEPPKPVESIDASFDDEAYLPDYNDDYAIENRRKIDTQEPEEANRELDVAEDDNGHSELGNLRDALETSLASPGGVELDESPVHSAEKLVVDTEEAHSAEVAPPDILEKASFPSRGPPAHEIGHASTESFSRTVSHVSQEETNWGEDDEVDPEWNLQRRGTDPFKFMAPSNRTNSFPAVQPLRSAPVQPEEHLAHTQAESVMRGMDEKADPFFEDGADDGFFTQSDHHDESADSPEFRAEAENEQDSYSNNYGQSYGGNLGEQDLGARYEEGVPLVPHHDGENDHPAQISKSAAAFGQDDGVDEDEDFFNQEEGKPDHEVTDELEPPKLDRKSTMQVMGALQYQGQNDSPSRDFSNPQRPLKPVTEDKSFMESQEPDALFFERQADASKEEPTEEDLAAKWQAELGEDELLEDDDFLPDDEPEKEEPDPSSFFGDDDDGFLEDSEETPQTTDLQQNTSVASVGGVNGQTAGLNQHNPYLPTAQNNVQQQNGNLYGPGTPLFTDLSSSRPGITSAATAPYGYGPSNNTAGPPVSFSQQQQPQRPDIAKAQSFADKAKGGYSSPYDLPMDLKPKKRASMQQMGRGYSMQAPSSIAPPRNSSYSQLPPPPSRGSTTSISPPTSSHSPQQFPGQQSRMSVPPPSQTAPPTLKSKGSFFEELPMTSRPKPAGRYTPQPSAPTPPGYSPVQPSPVVQGQRPAPIHSYSVPTQTSPNFPTPGQSLVAPARVSPYAATQNGMPPHVPQQMPPTATRYSPAPPPPRNMSAPPMPPAAAAASRYSPAPHHPPTAYVPRTSSPLAHFSESSQYGPGAQPGVERRSFSYEAPLRMAQNLPAPQEVDETQEQAQNYQGQISQGTVLGRSTPPPMHSTRSSFQPPKRSMSNNYDPVHQVQTSPQKSFVPPPRAQTQSPGRAFRGASFEPTEPYQRPESVHSPTSPHSTAMFQPITTNNLNVARTRPTSQSKSYISPTDGREHDPLERWKGCPIFNWGVGGTVVTSFPVEVPRYGQGRTAPMYICSPGEVKVRNVKDVLPLPERLASFPGPLKGKSKKKEVISWLSAGIDMLEKDFAYLSSITTLSHQEKRSEERILLWKILRAFIENDGVLEGNPTVVAAIRAILSPSAVLQSDEDQPLYATGADLSGIGPSAKSQIHAEPVDPAAVEELRKHLLRGERTKAVWEAVDKRLWAHAMLISNTVSKDLYKQVAQEFVREEVKNIGENTESLAVLYEIFAGNFEESIDELVPPSARAGFQMVSTSRPEASPSKSALDGLDRWRETLGLVLSNRSTDDSQALNALGKLLSGYGRAEAAHICFLFARSISVFGGFDDPSSNIVLVGSDHLRQPNDFAKELEPILLSEVYEYGSSLSAISAMSGAAPHLSIYKLQHAQTLAEYGFREKALAYCDAILASITSQTKRSPYHHSLLLTSLDDLTQRLKASRKDESNSWISKPSIEKVSGSVWNKFNKFVAGDENDGSTPAAGADGSTEVGPFAKIAGGTPTISRSPSQADIYGSYNGGPPAMGGIPIPGANRVASRYAPAASYTPPAPGHEQISSSYGSQPRRSFEQPRSSDELRRGPYEPLRQSSDYNRPTSQAGSVSNGYTPLSQQLRQPQHYQNPYASVADSPYSGSTTSLLQSSPYPPTPNTGLTPAPMMNESPQSIQLGNAYEQMHPSAGYEPPKPANEPQQSNFGYPPPSSGNTGYEQTTSSYEAPSYNTSYVPEPDSPIDTRSKQSYNDDDDPRAAEAEKPRQKTKAEIDREVDEAFRKAAEEDAKRDAQKPAKKGWGLTGWFGGGAKKESTPDMSQPKKAVRAKLGEKSTFVYDPDLKRWVNKNDPDSANAGPRSTPPPPKGPPSRSASGSNGPPSSRPSSSASIHPPPMLERTDSEISGITATQPPLRKADSMMGLRAPPASFQRSVSNSSLGPGVGAGSAPPSRPATGAGSVGSLDDLLGPGGLGKRGTGGKKKKGGRYVDIFPTGGAGAS